MCPISVYQDLEKNLYTPSGFTLCVYLSVRRHNRVTPTFFANTDWIMFNFWYACSPYLEGLLRLMFVSVAHLLCAN